MNRIRILIVDDELTSRNTIKKLLEGSEIYEVAGDFSNGKMALDWLRQNTADIMLCDMQMPGIDGVELMRSVHIINEYLPIIAISGFDDFDYVRGSLINGACNYLLKHELTEKQLLYVLDQVRERYRIVPAGGEVYYRRGYCIYDEKEFSAEGISKLIDRKYIEFKTANIIAVAISPDYRFKKGIHEKEYRRDIVNAVIDMLNQMLGDRYPYLIHVTGKGHIIPLVSFTEEKSTLLMMNVAGNLVRRIQNQIVRMLDITATIVVGDVQRTLEQALEQARRMDGLLEDKMYLGGNRIVSEAIAQKLDYSEKEIPDNLWNQLQYELKNQMDGYLLTVRDVLDVMGKERLARQKVIKNCSRILELLEKNTVLDAAECEEMYERIKQHEEYTEIRSEILETLNRKNRMRQSQEHKYSSQIMQAAQYIEQNYMQDISLEKCAEVTGISYTYLSRSFKKETGMRFVEFLNRCRVNKAKSLLVRKDIPMREIAQRSGFRNYNYFFKVFKEMEGMTPTEFLTKN